MKQEWSKNWVRSKQQRKQRKYRKNAPLHVRHSFLSAHLSPGLRENFGRRSLPLRKGDEVLVMRGGSKGKRGLIDSIDKKKSKVYIDNVKIKKVDGSEVHTPFDPSNLMITNLDMDDKRRKVIIDRKKPAKETKKEVKPKKQKIEEPKDEPKKEVKPKEEDVKEQKPKEEDKKPVEKKEDETKPEVKKMESGK